jgi:hypothetical protein
MLQDFDRAERCIDRALQLDPKNESCLELKTKILLLKPKEE